jgi:ABC-type antimicrobial peptide transport system permease subunit
MVVGGIAVGLAASLAVTRLLTSQLYHVSTTDPPAFAGSAVLFLLVAALASYVPARRAMRVDPILALRQE